jgi:hypothetical protein
MNYSIQDHVALKKKADELAERAQGVQAIEASIKKLTVEGHGEGVGGQAGI